MNRHLTADSTGARSRCATDTNGAGDDARPASDMRAPRSTGPRICGSAYAISSRAIHPRICAVSVRVAGQRAWAATLYDNGLAVPAWPREYGGMALSFAQQVAYYDQFATLKTPPHPGNGPLIAGPTLLKFGMADQKSHYLPAMRRGDAIWAQGFSEPQAQARPG
jgi:alkylation response protein AidB-like acyl-CoA dehydrogenase